MSFRSFCFVVTIISAFSAVCVTGFSSFRGPSNPLQLLQNFGLNDGMFGDSSRVTLGKGKRKGDSPIYYIKLPPIPHFQYHQPAPKSPFASNLIHQLDVDFITNGKPEQVYHWNYKPHVPMYTPETATSPPALTNDIIDSVAMPPEIPLIAPSPMKPQKPSMEIVQKPFISLKKNFFYNGKPSGVYIFKSRPQINPAKYKHPYFKHFNY